MRIVIKVGSQSILNVDGTPLLDVMTDVIEQLIQLNQAGHQVVLVSSGAVALGRGISRRILAREYATSVADKQLMASIGQPQLMAIYTQLCEARGYIAAQLLLTKYDFQTKRSYTNILRLLQKSLAQENIITIINENDSVAVDELMFTDNDELSGIIAAQIGADKLLLLTSIDGVYTKNPSEPDAQLIKEVYLTDELPDLTGKTSLGRGGMSSKLTTARKMARAGVMTHIASLIEPQVIQRLVVQNEDIGTKVVPEQRQAARKKYLAFTQGTAHAQITINAGLVNALKNNHSISILPIGILEFKGEFKRGDMLEIISETGDKIGVGIARYNTSKLSEYIGQHAKPELIHHDYLHIDYDKIG